MGGDLCARIYLLSCCSWRNRTEIYLANLSSDLLVTRSSCSGGGQAVLVVFFNFLFFFRVCSSAGDRRIRRQTYRSSFSYHKAKTLCWTDWQRRKRKGISVNRLVDNRHNPGCGRIWSLLVCTLALEERGMGRAVIFSTEGRGLLFCLQLVALVRMITSNSGEGEHLTRAYRRFNNNRLLLAVEQMKKTSSPWISSLSFPTIHSFYYTKTRNLQLFTTDCLFFSFPSFILPYLPKSNEEVAQRSLSFEYITAAFPLKARNIFCCCLFLLLGPSLFVPALNFFLLPSWLMLLTDFELARTFRSASNVKRYS